MAVLADRVRAGQIRKAVIADVDPARASQFVDWMREDIADAPVIVIDNVAEYALGPGSPRHGWDVSDFPNAAPPWPIAWFEYRIPPNAMPVEDGPDQLGFWVAAEDTDDGWNLHCSGYGWYGREIRGPIAAYRVGVAPDGSVREFGPYPLKNAAPESALSTLPYLVPVLLAISFAHCKNVSERVISPPRSYPGRSVGSMACR